MANFLCLVGKTCLFVVDVFDRLVGIYLKPAFAALPHMGNGPREVDVTQGTPSLTACWSCNLSPQTQLYIA